MIFESKTCKFQIFVIYLQRIIKYTIMITTISQKSQDISTVDALWTLIQNQTKSVRKALVKRILDDHEQQRTLAQQQMVKDSLTRAFDELHSGKVHHNARDLFKK